MLRMVQFEQLLTEKIWCLCYYLARGNIASGKKLKLELVVYCSLHLSLREKLRKCITLIVLFFTVREEVPSDNSFLIDLRVTWRGILSSSLAS